MTLPKTLNADREYPEDIRDEKGDLVLCVTPSLPDVKELRDEIVYRYNCHDTLRDVLKHAIAIVAERELESKDK